MLGCPRSPVSLQGLLHVDLVCVDDLSTSSQKPIWDPEGAREGVPACLTSSLPSPDEGAPSLSVSSASIFTRKAKVKKQLLKEVVENNKWRVNNKYDRSRTPLPVEEIIRRAERWIDQEVPYDVLGSNCEHFVTELRYGKGVSGQVSDTG